MIPHAYHVPRRRADRNRSEVGEQSVVAQGASRHLVRLLTC